MLEKRDKVQAFLEDRHRGFLKNLPNLKYGYPFTALDKILQADVPVVLVAETVESEELKILHEIRENVCVIAINKAWKFLFENAITPDFIMGDSFGEFDARLNQVAVIANVETEYSLLEYHTGKQFFYWTENTLIPYMCEESAKRPNYPGAYSVMVPLPNMDDVYERAVYIAEYMNASKIILFGVDVVTPEKFSYPQLIRVDVDDTAQMVAIRENCRIKCYVQDSIEVLLPLLNAERKAAFDALIEKIQREITLTLYAIEKNVEGYRQLYHMAVEEVVYQEDLDRIVSSINEFTREINKNGMYQCCIQFVGG